MPVSEFTNLSGRALTRGLFFETSISEDKAGVMYTLWDVDREEDGVTYPSLYKLYMEMGDPTEWEFSKKYLNGWSHWQMITESVFFKEYLDRWRWELSLKIRSKAVAQIMDEANGEKKNSYQANKFLVDGGWLTREESKSKVGRPTQERIKREAEKLRILEQEINEDRERIN